MLDKFFDSMREKHITRLLGEQPGIEQKMYSEEESIQKIIDYVDFQFNTGGELNSEIKKWFEQFKKK